MNQPVDFCRASSPKSVCVYCGSSARVDQAHKDTAREVGSALARHGIKVVYGGGRVGLMGILADSVLEAGGKVVGIIPEYIRSREIQHTGLTEMHVVDSMHTRKRMMVDRADAFLVLPGGFGTMDEAFEVLTWRQLGLHDRNIVIYNKGGFWDPLLALIGHLIDSGFAPANNRSFYSVVSDLDGLFSALAAEPAKAHDPMSKWI